MTHLLFFDHRDSFSANLVALFRAEGAAVTVFDAPSLSQDSLRVLLRGSKYCGLVLSPGPGHPANYPTTRAALELASDLPVLGVCLGHQMLAEAAGARVRRGSGDPVHGRVSDLVWQAASKWLGDLSTLQRAALYNSLAASAADCRAHGMRILAEGDDGTCLALEASARPHIGVQFHPESFATPNGSHLAKAFIELAARKGRC